MKKIIVSVASALLLMGVAQVAFAAIDPGTIPAGPQTRDQLLVIIDNVINLVFTALIVFSVIYIIMAAFQFVSAGGDLAAVTQARQKLIYAIVGIIVALVAKGIPFVIRSVLGGGTSLPS